MGTDERGEMVRADLHVLLPFIPTQVVQYLPGSAENESCVHKHTLTPLSDCPITHATLAVFTQPIHINTRVVLRSQTRSGAHAGPVC